MRFLSLIALAAPLVSAIEFTSPAANSTVTKGTKVDLAWSTVDTDPESFSIYLVNFVNWPPFYTPLAYDVETASGWAEVTVPCNIDNSWGYQLYVSLRPPLLARELYFVDALSLATPSTAPTSTSSTRRRPSSTLAVVPAQNRRLLRHARRPPLPSR